MQHRCGAPPGKQADQGGRRTKSNPGWTSPEKYRHRQPLWAGGYPGGCALQADPRDLGNICSQQTNVGGTGVSNWQSASVDGSRGISSGLGPRSPRQCFGKTTGLGRRGGQKVSSSARERHLVSLGMAVAVTYSQELGAGVVGAHRQSCSCPRRAYETHTHTRSLGSLGRDVRSVKGPLVPRHLSHPGIVADPYVIVAHSSLLSRLCTLDASEVEHTLPKVPMARTLSPPSVRCGEGAFHSDYSVRLFLPWASLRCSAADVLRQRLCAPCSRSISGIARGLEIRIPTSLDNAVPRHGGRRNHVGTDWGGETKRKLHREMQRPGG